jgi:hypothetical protein
MDFQKEDPVTRAIHYLTERNATRLRKEMT